MINIGNYSYDLQKQLSPNTNNMNLHYTNWFGFEGPYKLFGGWGLRQEMDKMLKSISKIQGVIHSVSMTVSRGKPSVAETLGALPTHASDICLQCSSIPIAWLNKWA